MKIKIEYLHSILFWIHNETININFPISSKFYVMVDSFAFLIKDDIIRLLESEFPIFLFFLNFWFLISCVV